ncbi:MAG: hypothetical protein VW405_16820 [Rhodospirillaceae bacterium]
MGVTWAVTGEWSYRRMTPKLVFVNSKPPTNSSALTSQKSQPLPRNSPKLPSGTERLPALALELVLLDPEAAEVVEAMLESILCELRRGAL